LLPRSFKPFKSFQWFKSFKPGFRDAIDAKSEGRAFRSARSLNLRLIRLQRKWFSASKDIDHRWLD
jgi:hypothetical protein